MAAAPAPYPDHRTIGRAHLKGGFWRALPQFAAPAVLLASLLAGAALVAKALYIPLKAEVAQVLLDRAFEASLASGEPVKPWSWADTAPIARITVPRLGASDVVLSGGSGEAMAFGPTAIHDAPHVGVTVLAAHRDTHFEFVRDLAIGDRITLTRIDGTSEAYRVTRMETVRWDGFHIPARSTAGLLALTTCYPFDTDRPGPLRRIAWAARITD